MLGKSIMLQGTGSGVGKSYLVTALCRILRQEGYRVAPFKAQNMALNPFITADGLEMGHTQAIQAEACGLSPAVEMNPVLYKPAGDRKAQVIVLGKVYGTVSADSYPNFKRELKDTIRESYGRLAKQFEIIVIDGAGSPAEINLREEDLDNMGLAEMFDVPVLLVGDIDRGGVFAALAGTMLLLKNGDKRRVRGVIINKFRGDLAFLKPGLDELEFIISRPTLGVIPYIATDAHDIFDNQIFQQEILNNVCLNKALPGRFGSPSDYREFKEKEYNRLSGIVRSHIDLKRIKGIIFS